MPNSNDSNPPPPEKIESQRHRVREPEAHAPPSACNCSRPDPTEPSNNYQNYLKYLINTIPDLVWLKDPDGVYLGCNHAFERLFNASEGKIVGRTDYDFVDHELADFFRAHDKKAMASGKPSVNEEWLTMAASGERILVETIKTPMHDNNGVLIGVLGVARDITERKQVETALEKRLLALTTPLEETGGINFEDLFNLQDIQKLQDQFACATGVASLITKPDGTPITTPSNFCRLCTDIIRKTEKGRANCYKSDATLGRYHPDGPIMSPCMSGGLWDAGASISIGDKHVANWLIGQVRDETQTVDRIRFYARSIGADEDEAAEAFNEVTSMSREHFWHISQALFTIANKLSDIAFQNIQQARFITKLKQAEAELAKTRNFLTNIIDSMPSMLVGVDPDGNVTQWTIEAARMSNIQSPEAVGQPLGKVMPHLTEEMKRIREAMKSRTVISNSHQTRTLRGETRYEDITIYPLIANGVDGAVIRIDDVTDRVNLEQMMVQSEKMMSVGGLAAGMAHEINNPLAGILGYTHNIHKRIYGDLKKNLTVAEKCGVSLELVREYLNRRDIPRMIDGINDAGRRAALIVSNMLSFSRKSEKRLGGYDLAALLENTLELAGNDYNLKKYYDFRKIEIVREYDPNVPLIYCDGNEIQQVFLNLLRNGAEAMTTKKYTGGEQPRFTCRVKKMHNMAVVEIEDNGPGIDDKTRSRIFEPFYTTKEVGKGTGLGLSVSYFIVTDQHNGGMTVDSIPGKWTRFTITLPILKEYFDVAHDSDS